MAAAAAVGLVQRAGVAGDGESSQPAPRDGSPVESAAERDDVEAGANAFALGDDDELILVAPVRAKGSASRTASALDGSSVAAGVAAGDVIGDATDDRPHPSAPPRSSDHLYDAGEVAIDQLADLRRLPSRALGQPFRVHAVVCEIGGAWEPYFTRFDRATWRRVALWSDDARLWERAAFDDPLAFAFVRKGSALDERLSTYSAYDRVVVEGVVREVFAGEPWVELWSVRSAEPGLTEAGVFHAVRALEAQAKGLGPLARSELDKALAAPLPEHQRAALEELAASFEADGE